MLYKLFALTSLVIGMNATSIHTKNLVEKATSVILPNEKSLPKGSPKDVTGTLKLDITGIKTRITGKITGLKPNSVVGFHIHEFGDISSDEYGVIDCGPSATGGHWNPFNKLHGGPNAEERHAGDLGNIKSDKHGVANVDIFAPLVKLNGDNSVIGRSFVIHETFDDFSPSTPTGNAGDRVACGVIGIAKPKKTPSPTMATTTKHPTKSNNKIECTSLRISEISYEECNKDCFPGNDLCYYGAGAASKGQLCYCYTNTHVTTKKPTKWTTTEKPTMWTTTKKPTPSPIKWSTTTKAPTKWTTTEKPTMWTTTKSPTKMPSKKVTPSPTMWTTTKKPTKWTTEKPSDKPTPQPTKPMWKH